MQQRLSNSATFALLMLMALATMYMPDAAAQINTAQQTITVLLTSIRNMLIVIGGVLFTIAIIFAGFKMAFQHARWSDISHIVIGGILVGSATAIAGALIPATPA